MNVKTHVMGGVAAGLGMATISAHEPLLIVGAAAFGAIIPDVDHKGSTIARKVPPLSWLIGSIFGHRTFTHSLTFIGLAAWLMFLLPIHQTIIAGILVGIVSHIILDGFTKDGVMLLWPLRIKIRSPLAIRTGGPFEPVVLVALTALCIYWGAELLGGLI